MYKFTCGFHGAVPATGRPANESRRPALGPFQVGTELGAIGVMYKFTCGFHGAVPANGRPANESRRPAFGPFQVGAKLTGEP